MKFLIADVMKFLSDKKSLIDFSESLNRFPPRQFQNQGKFGS